MREANTKSSQNKKKDLFEREIQFRESFIDIRDKVKKDTMTNEKIKYKDEILNAFGESLQQSLDERINWRMM